MRMQDHDIHKQRLSPDGEQLDTGKKHNVRLPPTGHLRQCQAAQPAQRHARRALVVHSRALVMCLLSASTNVVPCRRGKGLTSAVLP